MIIQQLGFIKKKKKKKYGFTSAYSHPRLKAKELTQAVESMKQEYEYSSLDTQGACLRKSAAKQYLHSDTDNAGARRNIIPLHWVIYGSHGGI